MMGLRLLIWLANCIHFASSSCTDFYLEFENIKSVDVGALLSIPDKIHLVLITTDADGRTSLVSSHRLDWQRVLASEDGKLASSVELNGVGAEAKMMVGVLEINMTIVPKVAKVC